MTLNDVIALILCYFTEFDRLKVRWLKTHLVQNLISFSIYTHLTQTDPSRSSRTVSLRQLSFLLYCVTGNGAFCHAFFCYNGDSLRTVWFTHIMSVTFTSATQINIAQTCLKTAPFDEGGTLRARTYMQNLTTDTAILCQQFCTRQQLCLLTSPILRLPTTPRCIFWKYDGLGETARNGKCKE